MFKAIILLKKKEEVSAEEFKNWWINSHSSKAAMLPKIRKLCFNLVENEGDKTYDGVAEQWFDSQSDFEAAYASDLGKAVAADSMANVLKRDRLFVVEHMIVQP